MALGTILEVLKISEDFNSQEAEVIVKIQDEFIDDPLSKGDIITYDKHHGLELYIKNRENDVLTLIPVNTDKDKNELKIYLRPGFHYMRKGTSMNEYNK